MSQSAVNVNPSFEHRDVHRSYLAMCCTNQGINDEHVAFGKDMLYYYVQGISNSSSVPSLGRRLLE